MDDTKKMLRIILRNQNCMRKELLTALNKLDKNVTESFDMLESKFESIADKLDLLLYKLELRVKKVEQKVASI